jgi:16S rRNA (guanine527-N7)-methyltransferase
LSRQTARAPDLDADRRAALQLTPVSRETLTRLDRYVAHLLAWQAKINLIAPSTVSHLWTRHIADSLQLIDLTPTAQIWVDVGSGAGLPGLVLGCALADRPGALVHLVESNAKKSAFLREGVRLTGAAAVVHAERMEDVARRWEGPLDVVCARAVAPIKSLLEQCFFLVQKNGVTALFPKGHNVQSELDEASETWKMRAELVPSRTAADSRIVIIRELERLPVGNKVLTDSRAAKPGLPS